MCANIRRSPEIAISQGCGTRMRWRQKWLRLRRPGPWLLHNSTTLLRNGCWLRHAASSDDVCVTRPAVISGSAAMDGERLETCMTGTCHPGLHGGFTERPHQTLPPCICALSSANVMLSSMLDYVRAHWGLDARPITGVIVAADRKRYRALLKDAA
jgi:hypothetical protein